MWKIREKRDWQEKEVTESESLLINREKHIGEIKYKTPLAEKILLKK